MSSYCLKLLVAISLFVIQTHCKEKHPIKDLGHNLHNYPIALDSPNINEGHSDNDPNISDDEIIPVTTDFPSSEGSYESYVVEGRFFMFSWKK